MNADYNKAGYNIDSMNENANQNLDTASPSATTAKIEDHTAENKLPAPHDSVDSATMLNATSDNSINNLDINHLDTDTLNANNSDINNQNAVNHHLELLEERPVVNKERLDVGKVTVTKHTRTKTIEVPIELVEEYVTIRTEYNDAESQDLLSGSYDEKDILRHVEPSLDSKAVVTINGKQIEVGDEPVEIVLSRQVATITKDTYAIQEIEVNKTTHTHTDSIQVELKHEELDVIEEGFLEHEASRVHKK
ncbi:YsnF/AvaK domain-containing protein [Psychrobacter sp. P2G3]|uniref:YsnF/AvaK domain-containing protein n=1 Tax=Psychrobacter sp. P2G3 TaxID=1699622 RepID=UPI000A8C43E7|nr:YsnF/AvaK domain-containing protein [Psychrobacter sp. P2G3]